MMKPAASRLTWEQLVVALGGLLYTLTGLAMLFAPIWFYETIGTFPPFNRHFLGDLGTFLLPLGLALLVAARQPAGHWLVIGVGAAASLLHALNHAYDDWAAGVPLSHWFGQTVPLLLFALVLMAAYHKAGKMHAARGAG